MAVVIFTATKEEVSGRNWLLFEFGVKVDVGVTFITIIMSYSNVTEAT